MIDLTRLKSHLRIDDNNEDEYLEFILAAALQAAEDYFALILLSLLIRRPVRY
ncbi:Phage gp6-like head-tail connector protein (plasmid) [Piscirickettsia salmonis]|uniref:head-tail connector protein n=1 Tax=Piscirickettsia salmonis TaxID=1238 RepID=UPI0012BA61B5|nr:head-tail connector protein [Piscirickettsia salmonis]QGO68579.1 Phage gp6-like head-tail connector protein [Piscirickettsia salmonis]